MRFTFHDVSINTGYGSVVTGRTSVFTFHDVSINTVNRFQEMIKQQRSLHSTMFLLIRNRLPGACWFNQTLHSTMFLLIPVVYSSLQYRYNLTTFCQSCHFIIFILIFIFLDSSHFWNFPDISSIVDLLKFLLYLTSTIIIWNSLNHPSYPKILYPTIFPAEI